MFLLSTYLASCLNKNTAMLCSHLVNWGPQITWELEIRVCYSPNPDLLSFLENYTLSFFTTTMPKFFRKKVSTSNSVINITNILKFSFYIFILVILILLTNLSFWSSDNIPNLSLTCLWKFHFTLKLFNLSFT